MPMKRARRGSSTGPSRSRADTSPFSMAESARAIARWSPARTRSASDTSVRPEQLPRDHQPLHLARALPNGAQLHIAKVFFGWIVLHETVPAMNLHAFLSRANGRL